MAKEIRSAPPGPPVNRFFLETIIGYRRDGCQGTCCNDLYSKEKVKIKCSLLV